jgi:hypothetical protein
VRLLSSPLPCKLRWTFSQSLRPVCLFSSGPAHISAQDGPNFPTPLLCSAHRRPAVSDPPPPPLAVGEAHRRPPPLFSSTAARFHAQGTVPAILRRTASETVSVVHRGPAPPTVHGLVDLIHRFSFRKTIPENFNFWHFALRPLNFFNINP